MKAEVNIYIKSKDGASKGQLKYSIDEITIDVLNLIKERKEMVLGTEGNGLAIVFDFPCYSILAEHNTVCIYGARPMEEDNWGVFWLLEHGAEYSPNGIEVYNPAFKTHNKDNWQKIENSKEYYHKANAALRTIDFKTMYFRGAKDVQFPIFNTKDKNTVCVYTLTQYN